MSSTCLALTKFGTPLKSEESIRATRVAVQIGSLTVDGFMLPDGSYRMSQTQVAEAAGSRTAQRVRLFTLKRRRKLAE